LAERAAPEWWGPTPGVWLDRLAADYDNLRAALEWALVDDDPQLGGRLVAALHWYWRIRGPVTEGRRWMEAILSSSGGVEPRVRAAVLTRVGDLAMLQGDLTQAADLLAASITLAQEVGDRPTTTWAMGQRGLLALHQGQIDQAAVDLTHTLNRARVDGPPAWVPAALGQLASIARRRGDLVQEATLLEEALATSEAAGMTWYTAGLRCQLGDAAVDREAFAHAEAHYREALGPFQAMHERRNMAGVLAGFAWIAAARRDTTRAAYLCGAVDALLTLTGVILSPHGQIRYERARAAAEAALPAAAFTSAVSAGQHLSLEQVMAEMEGRFTSRSVRSPAHVRAADELTEREVAVLRMLITRQTDKEIAAGLFLGPRTVQSHVASILAKLGVANRREAAEEARRRGLV
jgi:non-specific serine/threonine protein kinase